MTKKTNAYIFKEGKEYIDTVTFDFDLKIRANIDATNIKAKNIQAWDIVAESIKAENIDAKDIVACDIKADSIDANNIIAHDIIARDIYAKDISYWAVCSAYYNITCNSIKGRRKNAKHFVLDGELEVTENE